MGSLVKLLVCNPDPRVAEVISGLGLSDAIDFAVGPAQLTATIETPNGIVELS
jgi:anti-anti-sigma regulatory factor